MVMYGNVMLEGGCSGMSNWQMQSRKRDKRLMKLVNQGKITKEEAEKRWLKPLK